MTKIDEAIRAAQEAYSVYGKTGDLRASPPSAGNVKSMLVAALAVLLPAEPSEKMVEKIVRDEFTTYRVYYGYTDEAKQNEWFRMRNIEIGTFKRQYRALRAHLGLTS